MGGPDSLHLKGVPHAGLLQVGPEDPVDEPHGGEVLYPGEAEEISSSKYLSQMTKGSVPLMPARTGVFFTTGRTS